MVNTINMGPMLVEEDALMPESLRFESEPWTFFHLAGGTIRQLRKAMEKKRTNALPPGMELAGGNELRQGGMVTQLSVAANLNL